MEPVPARNLLHGSGTVPTRELGIRLQKLSKLKEKSSHHKEEARERRGGRFFFLSCDLGFEKVIQRFWFACVNRESRFGRNYEMGFGGDSGFCNWEHACLYHTVEQGFRHEHDNWESSDCSFAVHILMQLEPHVIPSPSCNARAPSKV